MDQVKKFFEVVRKFCSPTAQKRAHPPEGNLPSPSQPDLELDQDMLLDLDMAPLEERENCEEAQRIFDQGLVHSPRYFSLSPPSPAAAALHRSSSCSESSCQGGTAKILPLSLKE